MVRLESRLQSTKYTSQIEADSSCTALQTAIALATFEAEEEAEEDGVRPGKIVVRDTHFQTVVDRRKEFIAYRKHIRNLDEEGRAYTEGSRTRPEGTHISVGKKS
jgi:hypothetical protein